MSEYEVYYSLYDIEVYDYNGDAVVVTDAVESEDFAEELFNKLSIGAGGTMVLRELQYSNRDYTGYLRTVILKTRKQLIATSFYLLNYMISN